MGGHVEVLTPGPGDRVVIDHARRTISGRVSMPDHGPCPARWLRRETDLVADFGDGHQAVRRREFEEPCIGRARHGGQHADRFGNVWGKADNGERRRGRRRR